MIVPVYLVRLDRLAIGDRFAFHGTKTSTTTGTVADKDDVYGVAVLLDQPGKARKKRENWSGAMRVEKLPRPEELSP